MSALLVAGAAGCALGAAKAASEGATEWTTTTWVGTQFQCVSDNCNAGGPGPVARMDWVSPPKIGAWSRTVAIHCKTVQLANGYTDYQVEVRDANWTGTWKVAKNQMAQAIDDSGFPDCPL